MRLRSPPARPTAGRPRPADGGPPPPGPTAPGTADGAVHGRDLAHEAEADAGALRLGGIERHEDLLPQLGRHAHLLLVVAPGDADQVLAAGWPEQALHDAGAVCGLFSLMNRLVEGLGITAGEDYFQISARRLTGQGYAALRDLL